MSESSTSYRQIIEAPVSALTRLAADKSLSRDVLFYAQVLRAYFQGDVEQLENLQAQLKGDSLEWSSLKLILDLRVALRKNQITADSMESCEKAKILPVFRGERAFLLGLSAERLGEDLRAAEFFKDAYRFYREELCPRKALRSLYNVVAAESRAWPHKNFVSDLHAIVQESEALGEKEFAGMAQITTSREYQKVGLLQEALALANEGIKNLSSEHGSSHFYHALLHRVHLLMESGDYSQAEKKIAELAFASFPDVVAAQNLLKQCLEGQIDTGEQKNLLPTWVERIPELELLISQRKNNDSQLRLGRMEERLMRLLWESPKNRWDLIETLFPGESDSEKQENRFKNLVARLRKKLPGQLRCKDSLYSLDVPVQN